AARCKSIFDNAGIAAVVFERRARGWRDVRRAKLAEAGGRRFFFFPAVSAGRGCCRKAETIIVIRARRGKALPHWPSKRSKTRFFFLFLCARSPIPPPLLVASYTAH